MVDVGRQGVLDAAREGLDDRLLDLREPVLEEERGQRRLEQRGEDVAVAREPLQLVLGQAVRPLGELAAQLQLPPDDRAARPRDDV